MRRCQQFHARGNVLLRKFHIVACTWCTEVVMSQNVRRHQRRSKPRQSRNYRAHFKVSNVNKIAILDRIGTKFGTRMHIHLQMDISYTNRYSPSKTRVHWGGGLGGQSLNTYIHTYIHTYIGPYIHACDDMHACMHAHTRAAHACMHASMHAYMSLHTRYIYMDIHIITYVYIVSCDVHFRYSDDAFMWTA